MGALRWRDTSGQGVRISAAVALDCAWSTPVVGGRLGRLSQKGAATAAQMSAPDASSGDHPAIERNMLGEHPRIRCRLLAALPMFSWRRGRMGVELRRTSGQLRQPNIPQAVQPLRTGPARRRRPEDGGANIGGALGLGRSWRGMLSFGKVVAGHPGRRAGRSQERATLRGHRPAFWSYPPR